MKSEQRHELQTSELDKVAAKIEPFMRQHGTNMLLGLVAILLVTAGTIWWVRSSGSAAQQQWTKMLTSTTTEDFAGVAEEFSGTDAGHWAKLIHAERMLGQGIQLSFSDRSGSDRDLEQAEAEFREVLEVSQGTPAMRERALYGLAVTLETTSNADTGPAISAYEQLLKEFPDTVYKNLANNRVEDLKKGGVQQFYAWFDEQNPKPEDREQPTDGVTGDTPDFQEDPTELPDIPDDLAPFGMELPEIEESGLSEDTAPSLPDADGTSASEDGNADDNDQPSDGAGDETEAEEAESSQPPQ